MSTDLPTLRSGAHPVQTSRAREHEKRAKAAEETSQRRAVEYREPRVAKLPPCSKMEELRS